MSKLNSYPGRCRCGAFVPALTGTLGPRSKGRCTVRCAACTAAVRPLPAGAACDCDKPGCWGCDAVYDAIKDGEY